MFENVRSEAGNYENIRYYEYISDFQVEYLIAATQVFKSDYQALNVASCHTNYLI